jgi:hypothetical protein
VHGGGSVFELKLDKSTNKWTEKTLYNFCRTRNCTGGQEPTGSLIMSPATGELYGTTLFGGIRGNGTVFKLISDRSKTNGRMSCSTRFVTN